MKPIPSNEFVAANDTQQQTLGPGIVADDDSEGISLAGRAGSASNKRNKKPAPVSAVPIATEEQMDALFAEYKQAKALTDEEALKKRQIFDAILHGMNYKPCIPKVNENTPIKNVDLLHGLLNINGMQAAQGETLVNVGTNNNGHIRITEKSTTYHGDNFDMDQARYIINAAIHNSTFAPPEKIKLQGTNKEKKLLRAAIIELNETLAPESRLIMSGFGIDISGPIRRAEKFRPEPQPQPQTEKTFTVSQAEKDMVANAKPDDPAYKFVVMSEQKDFKDITPEYQDAIRQKFSEGVQKELTIEQVQNGWEKLDGNAQKIFLSELGKDFKSAGAATQAETVLKGAASAFTDGPDPHGAADIAKKFAPQGPAPSGIQ